MTAGARALRERLGHEVAALEHVIEDLRELAERFVAAIRAPAGAAPVRDDLGVLRPLIHELISEPNGSIAGAGVITAPGLLADAPRWLEWWWTATGGTPEALRVNLDESTPDFFDYTSAEWYSVPMTRLRPHAAGPYVDFFCTNEYTITFAVPACGPDGPIGVAASDVLVGSLEPRFVPILRAIGRDAVLTNADGRVIVSGTARWAPGELRDLTRDVQTVRIGSRGRSAAAGGVRLCLARER